jgi:hypothetical protein
MRIFPRSPWRPLALVLLGLVLIGWRISKWIPPRHVYDRADVIADQPEMLANLNLAVLRERYGVDARFFLLDTDSISDLASYALNAMRRYRVGDSEGGRSLRRRPDRN